MAVISPVQYTFSRAPSNVRVEIPHCLSVITSQSDNGTVIEATPDQEICVYAYSLTTVATSGGTITFNDDDGPLWGVQLVAPSGTIAGANLAVTPPGFIFKSKVNSRITAVFDSPFSDNVAISLAYFVQARV